jgi:hypothetical protein
MGGRPSQTGALEQGDATVLNYFAVLLAGLASFVFGAAWYGALAKPWLAARGLAPGAPQPLPARLGPIPVPYLIALLAELVMAWMLAGVVLHLARGGLAPSPRTAAISAGFLWLGFVVTTLGVNHAFQGAKTTLTLIDGGHWLGVLLIQGTIIGAWGVR